MTQHVVLTHFERMHNRRQIEQSIELAARLLDESEAKTAESTHALFHLSAALDGVRSHYARDLVEPGCRPAR